MPPKYLFDTSHVDFTKIQHPHEEVLAANAQRGDFEMLDGIIWAEKDSGRSIGFKDVRADEFWVAGHIPGRPLFPGVLMLESAAQLASFYTRRYVGWNGFIGFGGVESAKFRQAVIPGDRLILLCQHTWNRHRRIGCDIQGLVDNAIAFECTIIGTQMGEAPVVGSESSGP